MSKVAIVTGGGLGLGRATAVLLAKQNYRVAIFGRNAGRLNEAVQVIGMGTLAVPVDVGDPQSVRAGFAKVDEALGPVDVLVNNAGTYIPFAIEEAEDDKIKTLVDTNFLGTIYCIREAVRRMKKNGGGDIVNVTSEGVRRPVPFFTVYGATKAGVENLVMALNEELRRDGIRLSSFRVGKMLTEGTTMVQVPAGLTERILADTRDSGFGVFTGVGMSAESAAAMLVTLLAAPRDTRAELLEVRSAL